MTARPARTARTINPVARCDFMMYDLPQKRKKSPLAGAFFVDGSKLRPVHPANAEDQAHEAEAQERENAGLRNRVEVGLVERRAVLELDVEDVREAPVRVPAAQREDHRVLDEGQRRHGGVARVRIVAGADDAVVEAVHRIGTLEIGGTEEAGGPEDAEPGRA